jgi:hypothetical protein
LTNEIERVSKKLYIKTYGCQMNVYDSARMADVLAPLGFTPAETADGADMVIFNTCHIREKAEEKLFSDLGRLKPLKHAKTEAGGRMIVAVAGCVAQAEGAEIMRRAPADLSSPARDGGAGRARDRRRHSRYELSGRGEIRFPAGRKPAARRLGLSVDPGRLR